MKTEKWLGNERVLQAGTQVGKEIKKQIENVHAYPVISTLKNNSKIKYIRTHALFIPLLLLSL